MTSIDIARVIVYAATAIPAIAFVVLYLLHLPRLRLTVEGLHLLIFTGAVGFIVVDFGVSLVVPDGVLWEISPLRFLVVMGLVALMLWQRLWLLLEHLVIPLAKKRRERRQNPQGET